MVLPNCNFLKVICTAFLIFVLYAQMKLKRNEMQIAIERSNVPVEYDIKLQICKYLHLYRV